MQTSEYENIDDEDDDAEGTYLSYNDQDFIETLTKYVISCR